jgi:hypothetical protein
MDWCRRLLLNRICDEKVVGNMEDLNAKKLGTPFAQNSHAALEVFGTICSLV